MQETQTSNPNKKKWIIAAGILTTTIVLVGIAIYADNKSAGVVGKLAKGAESIAERASVKNLINYDEKTGGRLAEKVANGVINHVQNYTSPTEAFRVSEHLRTIPSSWHASPEKIAEAVEKGIELSENQTWVSSYIKGL